MLVSLPLPPSNSALEFKRTTTSMSLADEKSIIREVDKIKNAKLQLEEYNSYERMVQEKKVSCIMLQGGNTMGGGGAVSCLYVVKTHLGCTSLLNTKPL